MFARALDNPFLTALLVYCVYQMLYTGYETRRTRRIAAQLAYAQHLNRALGQRAPLPDFPPGLWQRTHNLVQTLALFVFLAFVCQLFARLWQGF